MANVLVIVSIIIPLYFLVVFILSRFFIPHLGWHKETLPDDIPDTWRREIDTLKNQSGNGQEFLLLAYDYLGQKYFYASRPFFRRFKVFTNFPTLFANLVDLYEIKGFIHCAQLNFLLRLFLIKSGFFQEEDIKIKHVFVNFFIHQYLEVRINDNLLAVDVFGYNSGLKIGQHLKIFNP